MEATLEHLTPGQAEGFRRRRLSPEELIRGDDHLAGCEPCRRQIAADYDVGAAVAVLRLLVGRETEEEDHLSYERLAGYADGGLEGVERELAEGHLESCPSCRDEVRELRMLEAFSSRRNTPGEPAPSRLRGARPREWWALPRRRLLPVAAGLAAVLGTIAVVGPVRREMAAVHQKVHEIERENQRLEERLSRLQTPASVPRPVAALLDDAGEPVGLDQAGRLLGLEWLPPSARQAVRDALASRRLQNSPALKGLAAGPGTLLGPSGEGAPFALLDPVGKVVRSAEPRFRWRALPGAAHYEVAVFDSRYVEVARSGRLSGTSWSPSTPLARGSTYTWEVMAIRDGQEVRSPVPPAAEALFRVLDAPAAREIASVEARAPRSRLALGVLYARAGLAAEAEAELRALLEANPDSSEARALLRSVKAWPAP